MVPDRLSAERVAALLGPRLDAHRRFPGDERKGLLPAGVLVPLLEGEHGAELLYIRRSDELPDHSGQVSFPGGVHEAGDADLFATALRESEEEVGVAPETVRCLGALSPVSTLEKYCIHPFLSLWPDRNYAPASPREVQRVFRVPLARLLDPASQHEVEVDVDRHRLFVPAFLHDGEVIWGATRRITLDLLSRLQAAL